MLYQRPITQFLLGLCCCARAFSSCGKQGPLFIAVQRLLTAVGSLVSEHRLYGAWSSVVTSHGLRRCGSRATEPRFNRYGARTSLLHSNECGLFLDQRSTRVSCIGRWILYHWPRGKPSDFYNCILLHHIPTSPPTLSPASQVIPFKLL